MRKFLVVTLIALTLVIFAVQLTILHINDTHGHAWAFNEWRNPNIGGFAAIATLVKEIRQEVESKGGHVLFLHAGDINTGVPESDLLMAVPDITALNMMGLDAMTLGNHEFDKPRDVLEMQMKLAEFPILSANILKKDVWYEEYTAKKGDTLWKVWKDKGKGISWEKFVEKFKEFNKTDKIELLAGVKYKIPVYTAGGPFVKPYIIKDFGDLKVAIIGVTTEETKVLEPLYIQDLEFVDAAEAVQKYVDELKDKVDVIVVLAHLGWGEPKGDYNTSFSLARKVEGVDVIVDGHSHDLGMKTINGVTIVQAGYYGKWLGRLDLEVEDGKVKVKSWRALPINLKNYDKETGKYSYDWKEIKPDPMVEKALAGFKVLGGRQLDKVIGVTKIYLDGERAHIRSRSTNLGNLVADAIRWKAKADVALTNGGGIRASIKPGPITIRDILTVHPFGNTIYVMKLKGRQLMKVLQYAATIPAGKGAWPQISGMKVVVKNGKVVIAQVGDEPFIDPDKTYIFATNSYLAGGGDGYTMLKEWASQGYDTGFTLADAIIEYIQKVLGGVIESYDDSPRFQKE